MRITYVTNARLPTEKAHGLQIMKTCEKLAALGTGIELISPRRRNFLHEDPFIYYAIKNKFPLRRIWTLDLIRFGRFGFLIQEITFAIATASFLRSFKGIIYCRDEVVLAILILLGQTKVLWESHDGAWNAAARFVARRARAIVVVSRGLRDWYVKQGVPAEKITVIPNAIDTEAFAKAEKREDARKRLSLFPDAKIAMYIGQLDGWKGTDTLFEASRYIDPGIQIAVIGGAANRIKELSKKYPGILFLGQRPVRELPHNQMAADVLVVPNTAKSEISLRFTSPLKLLAHMASGVPIVASDLPSIREIASPDEVLLVPADDPRALGVGISSIFENSVVAKRRAERAKEKSHQFSWESRAKSIHDVISPI